MSTATNIDTNKLLDYICRTFSYWKINCVTVKSLKDAKDDKPEAVNAIKELLMKLCFLHILDYEYDLAEVGLKFEEDS